MTQDQLDLLMRDASEAFISYTNGYLDIILSGKPNENDTYNHVVRLSYLYGALSEVRLDGTTPYIGSAMIAGADVNNLFVKVMHYNRAFDVVDLTKYTDIVEDDGDGGYEEPDTGGGVPSTASGDHYRAGSTSVTAGGNAISFSSPLPSSSYQLDLRVETLGGYEQRNLVVSAKYAGGFVVSDVLESGTLYYTAIMDL